MDSKRKLKSLHIEKQLAVKLWKSALKFRKRAYAPYSKFLVGAAAMSSKGIIGGCNVENVNFCGSICAEQNLMTRTVFEKALPIKIICVVTKMKNDPKGAANPCGFCLQVLSEFCSPELVIWTGNLKGLVKRQTLKDLLPGTFKRGAF